MLVVSLVVFPPAKSQGLQLFHYVPDLLCSWQPTNQYIARLPCLCTIVNNDVQEVRDHFGKSEHSYRH